MFPSLQRKTNLKIDCCFVIYHVPCMNYKVMSLEMENEPLDANALYQIASEVSTGLVYDDESKMHFDRARDMYFDMASEVYYDYKDGSYYRHEGW